MGYFLDALAGKAGTFGTWRRCKLNHFKEFSA